MSLSKSHLSSPLTPDGETSIAGVLPSGPGGLKILVIQQKMIGDVLTSSILFEALRSNYPDAELHYLIQPHTQAVVEGNPYIDRIILDGQNRHGTSLGFLSFLKFIRNMRYDIVIDSYSKIGSAFLSFYSGAPLRISRKKWYTSFLYTKTIDYREKPITHAGLAVENRMQLLQAFGDFPEMVKPKIYLTENETEIAKGILRKHGIEQDDHLIMISMLGSSEKKTYPLSYLAELIELIASQTEAKLLLNYLPKQSAQVNELLSLCSEKSQKQIHEKIYAESLREFMAIAAVCDAIIGNEGGAINIAKALEVPTFAIFSPQISREHWDTFSNERNTAVHLNDFEPSHFDEKGKNKLRAEALTLYKYFKPDYIKSKLSLFLERLEQQEYQEPVQQEKAIRRTPLQKLTAIVPVFNEEHNIEGVLRSLDFVDEIIVVDSYSTDRTVEKARPFATRILQREFDYPASQKNWAIPQAKHKWILLLDADERVTPELKAEVQQTLINPPEDIDGYWIYRKNHFMGKAVRYSGWQNDKVVRLFRRDRCLYEDKMVHEEIKTGGKLGFLKERLYHNTYVSIDHYIKKLNRYADWQAIDYDKKTGKLTAFHLFVKPIWRFFKHYVIQQGFRDGFVGFTISYLQSYALVMRYIKLWLHRRGRE